MCLGWLLVCVSVAEPACYCQYLAGVPAVRVAFRHNSSLRRVLVCVSLVVSSVCVLSETMSPLSCAAEALFEINVRNTALLLSAGRARVLGLLRPAQGGLLWRSAKADVRHELSIPSQHHRLTPVQLSAIERHFYNRQHRV